MASANKREPKKLPADVKAALAKAVDGATSQRVVGDALGVSGSVVSQLLHDKYTGDVHTLADRIRGKYMAMTVKCPVMGTLGRDHCLDFQARPIAFTNPLRAALNKACKTCPNRKEAS